MTLRMVRANYCYGVVPCSLNFAVKQPKIYVPAACNANISTQISLTYRGMPNVSILAMNYNMHGLHYPANSYKWNLTVAPNRSLQFGRGSGRLTNTTHRTC